MTTADEFVVLAQKRFLSRDRLDTNFFTYLYESMLDLYISIFPDAGLFTFPVNIVLAPGTFDLVPLPPLSASEVRGIDNVGHVLQLVISPTKDRLTNIPFEDGGINDYWVALHYAEIPSGIYVNPRTGIPEYDKTVEEVGLRDFPDSVTDLVGTIKFEIDSVCPSLANSDYSGRYAWVWLRNPMSADISTALERCLISWDGSHNSITTTGILGQSTVSTDLNDYYVCLDGPCVYSAGAAGTTSNPYSDDYLVIGVINSLTGTVTDEALQLDLSGGGGHTLQKAYDGLGGSGSGRTVTVNDQAILLQQANTILFEKDIAHAALRVLKDDVETIPSIAGGIPYNIEDTEGAIDLKMRVVGISILDRRNIMDTSGADMLRGSEVVDLLGLSNNISFTRGGACNIQLPGLNTQLIPNIDLIEITGSALNQDGIYIVSIISGAATLKVVNVDQSTPSFTAEAGLTAKLYRPLMTIGRDMGSVALVSVQDLLSDSGAMASGFGALSVASPAYLPNNGTIATFARLNTPPDLLTITGECGIEADGNIETAQEFLYNADRTNYLNLGPPDCTSEDNTLNYLPYWIHEYAGGTDDHMIAKDVLRGLTVPIHLQENAQIKYIHSRVMIVTPSATWLKIELQERLMDFAATSTWTNVSTISASTVGAGMHTLSLDLSALPKTIVQDYEYAIVITSGDTVGDVWYYSQVEYIHDNVKPIV